MPDDLAQKKNLILRKLKEVMRHETITTTVPQLAITTIRAFLLMLETRVNEMRHNSDLTKGQL